MKMTITTMVLFLVFTTLAAAHGSEQHVMGTVTAMSANSISVKTSKNETTTVALTTDTKFIKSGSPAKATDLKVGDKVVIHAEKAGDKLTAHTVKFGVSTPSAVKHDQHQH